MKRFSAIFFSIMMLGSCGSGSGAPAQNEAAKQTETNRYTYTVKNVYPHLTTSYTQGLEFHDGKLWESTGGYGNSVLQTIDLASGKASVVAKLPQQEFGEGVSIIDGKVYQLTWQSNRAHVYDAASGKKTTDFTYTGEGWGLTNDGKQLYMSNGSDKIYVLDPDTFSRKKTIYVTLSGEPVNYINELEWIDGKIWANVYTTDQIAVIDPATGNIEGIIDLTGLLPEEDYTEGVTDVLNGIAYEKETKRIFVTGKNWNKIFEIGISEL